MKPKSKFLERLSKAYEDLRKDPVGPTEDSKVNRHNNNPKGTNPKSTQLAQYDWIQTLFEKPPYYTPIDIWDGKKTLMNWHRLSDGDNEFYANLKDNKIIDSNHVTYWRKLPGVKYPKYEPMTSDDVKIDPSKIINKIQCKLCGSTIRWKLFRGGTYCDNPYCYNSNNKISK